MLRNAWELFSALPAPSRLRILSVLSGGPSRVSNLVAFTGLSRPLILTHHVICDAISHTQEEPKPAAPA
ncbi:ArsR family transcriptional regulator [Arthrobacter sp. ISL-30]|uniref:ArsR family transcriptional regulator n=1 Tax=Arthrobacter sp. ISL-30 TaxID=2819109 RepID=UPI001BE558C7|nr:ArsR family transcriptional regulator [Arthrobacter sp. ISL-30]MBT2512573.1 ArsR family transcriptional regulator [Arthrobacter sp. ISL-30]